MSEEQQAIDGTSPEIHVLEMLANGKISVEEAQRLLNQLSVDSQEEASSSESGSVVPKDPRHLKFLRVCVDDEEDKVNIRVPLKLIMLGVKLDGIMGDVPKEAISSAGIDLGSLSALDEADFYEAIAGLQIDVSSEESSVRVFCE